MLHQERVCRQISVAESRWKFQFPVVFETDVGLPEGKPASSHLRIPPTERHCESAHVDDTVSEAQRMVSTLLESNVLLMDRSNNHDVAIARYTGPHGAVTLAP